METHDGNFAPGAPDDEWIREVGRRGWIVLSKDEKIRYRVAEKRAIAQAAIRAFFLVPKGLTGPENGRILSWPKLCLTEPIRSRSAATPS